MTHLNENSLYCKTQFGHFKIITSNYHSVPVEKLKIEFQLFRAEGKLSVSLPNEWTF